MERTLVNRVVVLIDMDCFYCQVEEKLDPELQGKPIAVVQYNPWKGGGIIAVNYVARAMGVTRHMRGDEAKEKCPEIQLPSVPCSRGKADISKYRDAGKDVAKVLQKFTSLLERASIDEAYLDITEPVLARLESVNIESINPNIIPNTYALGYDSIEDFIKDIQNYGNGCIDFDYENAKQMLVGAIIVSEIRDAVYKETGFRCSAGIAHNKILAKLVCGMNKPNKQTVLSKNSVNILYETLPLKKVKHLGGKFGYLVCEKLKIKNMGELQAFSEKDLQNNFDEKNGTWLYNIARGIDLEPVQARFNPKSIGCCKNFKGKAALLDLNSLKKWLKDLGDEIEDRLEKDSLENNRTPKQMIVSFSIQLNDGSDTSSSRSYNLLTEDELIGDFFSNKALDLVLESAEGVKNKDGEVNRKLKAPIKFLGISVGKFEENSEGKKTKKIKDYFTSGPSKINPIENNVQKNQLTKKQNCNSKEYIFKKFFQGSAVKNPDPQDKVENEELHEDKTQSNTVVNHGAIFESQLDKQESFFAKFLDKEKLTVIPKSDAEVRPTTPLCNIIAHGNNSNDSEYTGSTIDEEINKSIALFEDDPDEVDRVSSMRQLLTSTMHKTESFSDIQFNEEPLQDETAYCPECEKKISISAFQTHLDYHMALKLRDEERKLVKLQRSHKSNLVVQQNNTNGTIKTIVTPKTETISSIENFLIKLDNTIPHEQCAECGKRVAIDKFAEHLDFHAAQKINSQLNKKASTTNLLRRSAKRKFKSLSPVKKPKLPCRSIDSFFR